MTKDEIAEAEAVFAPAAIAEIAATLYKIRDERKRLERQEASLKDVLRKEIERTGEPISVEGMPTLCLVPVTQPYYDTSGLTTEEWTRMIVVNTEMIYSGEDPFIRVHDGQYKRAKARGLDVPLKAIRGQRTSQLRFYEDER